MYIILALKYLNERLSILIWLYRDDSKVKSGGEKAKICPGSKWCHLFRIYDSTIDTSQGKQNSGWLSIKLHKSVFPPCFWCIFKLHPFFQFSSPRFFSDSLEQLANSKSYFKLYKIVFWGWLKQWQNDSILQRYALLHYLSFANVRNQKFWEQEIQRVICIARNNCLLNKVRSIVW